jgi:hypothetical protein
MVGLDGPFLARDGELRSICLLTSATHPLQGAGAFLSVIKKLVAKKETQSHTAPEMVQS